MLLVRDDVGKAKPSTYSLPPEGFAYGKALPRDKEGAPLGFYYFFVKLKSEYDLGLPLRNKGSATKKKLLSFK